MTRRLAAVLGVACVALPVCLPGLAVAGPLTFDGEHDIGAMLGEARQAWDLAAVDGVLLLEHAAYGWSNDGRQREQHHRVVWVGSDVAQDVFADLRVPWDSERQTLRVAVLRVWRDERWIEARPTAVVETTPYALRAAPDYSGIRETMLLHDGIELPCVLECAYVIEDTVAFRGGMDGEWVFQHAVPALNSWLDVDVPAATPLWHRASTTAVAAQERIGGGDSDGRRLVSYRMRKMAAAPWPATAVPVAPQPYVRWSTYGRPARLGAAVRDAVVGGFSLDAALRDTLAAIMAWAPTAADSAQRIADFVKRSERRIEYQPRLLLPRARTASRVFATAYGGDLDLAILAGALFKEAGFTVWPAMRGLDHGTDDQDGWTLDRLQGPGLWVSGADYAAYWDAASGELQRGGASLHGRRVWRLGLDEQPAVLVGDDSGPSRLSVAFDLAWDASGSRWTGTGYLDARGALSFYDRMALPGGAARRQLDVSIRAVLAGAGCQAYSPQVFRPERVALHFDLEPITAAHDSLGRLTLVIGSPAGGLIDALPHDTPLYLAERETAVLLPSRLKQTVRLSIATGGLEVVRLPEAIAVANPAGRFELVVSRDAHKVTAVRTIMLTRARYDPESWPALRELLLAEVDAANRTVLLR